MTNFIALFVEDSHVFCRGFTSIGEYHRIVDESLETILEKYEPICESSPAGDIVLSVMACLVQYNDCVILCGAYSEYQYALNSSAACLPGIVCSLFKEGVLTMSLEGARLHSSEMSNFLYFYL